MANLKLKTLPIFPTKVTGTGGISVNKVNGVWTIDPDWTALTLVESVSAPEDKQLWCYDPSLDTYVRLSVDALIDSLPDGPPGGFKQNFDSATADADPGAGEFRFNNATVASATAAYLDNADVEGADISGLLDLWDNSTSTVRGMVRFEKTTDPSVWAQFEVTGSVVDGTGYRKITLQNGVSNGTFTAGDRFAVAFFGTGNTPTVSVGTATTLPAGSSATVTNSGTASDLVLDFGIPRGADASFKWHYESSTTMAAPAVGGMRFNNATLASVTAIAVNAQTADIGNPDQSDYIIKWDDSTSTPKAYVEIREEAGSSAVYQLSAVTDNTTWLQLDVAYVSGAIDLTAGDALYFTPHLIGNKGADGLGTGDVTAASSFGNDNRIIRSDGTGKGVQASGITVDDSDNVSGMATLTLPNTGLHILDTNASHDLIIAPGSDLTADRTLTVTTGDANRNLTLSADVTLTGSPIEQGKHTIWVPASAMITRTTNGAAPGTVEMTTNKNMVRTLDFDASTQEFAQFEIAMPKSWNEGTVTFQPVWSHPSTTTNFGVVWALQAVATSDDDALDVAFGTEQTSTDTGGTTNDRYIGPESSAITIGGTPAEGDVVQFQIKRNVSDGSDTMAVDARLHGLKVYLTLNAATDA